MEVRIVARHFELTPALHARIQEKIARLLRHFSGLIDCMVTLSTTKSKSRAEQHHAEINIHLRNKNICAKSDNENMYAAIEEATRKIDRQIVSHKDIIKNHHHIAAKKFSQTQSLQMVAEGEMQEQVS
ncbi:MAG: ribosomal subunit interface protein [Pseudomonadota bacterium]|jgi:putative sigma-54 modulation protein